MINSNKFTVIYRSLLLIIILKCTIKENRIIGRAKEQIPTAADSGVYGEDLWVDLFKLHQTKIYFCLVYLDRCDGIVVSFIITLS